MWKIVGNFSTLYTATDSGGSRWPWQWFAFEKADLPLFVTINRCILVKNTLGRSAVVQCACKLIHVFSVVLCVVTAVHKFEFGIVTNETPNKRRPVVGTSWNDKGLYF